MYLFTYLLTHSLTYAVTYLPNKSRHDKTARAAAAGQEDELVLSWRRLV